MRLRHLQSPACQARRATISLLLVATIISSGCSFQRSFSYGKLSVRQININKSCNMRGSLIQPMNSNFWEGDDLRFRSKIGRRIGRSINQSRQPARNILILSNILLYVYQVINSVQWIRERHPTYWPSQAIPILLDVAWGSAAPGPLTRDFVHSKMISPIQPHRFLTAGFLHGGLVHLLVNMDSLRRLPTWIEASLGAPLYVTTFLASIVTGNLAHSVSTVDVLDRTLCLGASGGICGLYGLMYVNLVRMGNSRAATQVVKGMGIILLYGFIVSGISNAAHAGGFVGGVIMGIVFGPRYRKSYGMRRKNSVEPDVYARDYRTAMGFGTVPTEGFLPVSVMWVALIFLLVSQPRFQSMPQLMLQALFHPGSVSALIR